MINLFTIGFTQKTAKEFFTLLKNAKIDCLVDVRLNNGSQLASYTKAKDLEYFLHEILHIVYQHSILFAPTKEILENYRKKKISWVEYQQYYLKLIADRKVEQFFLRCLPKNVTNICLLCSEPSSEQCHRRLLAEYLQQHLHEKIQITHL